METNWHWLLSLQPLSVLLEDNKQSGSPLNISVCLRGDLRLLQPAGHRDDMISTHLEYSALWKASTFTFVSLLHLFMRLFEFLKPLVNIHCSADNLKLTETMNLLFVKRKSFLEPPRLQQIFVLLPKYVYLKSHKSFMSFLAIQLHHSPSQNMSTTVYLAQIPSPLRLSLRRIIIFCCILAVDKKVGSRYWIK